MERKEAIEIVKSEHFQNGLLLEALKTLIPELENEDEIIRKTLIRLFKGDNAEQYNGITKEQVIAWLEKQGEQKFEWIENDDEDLSSIADKFISEPRWNALEESEGEGSNAFAYDYSQMIDMFKSGVQWFKSIKQNPLKIAKFKVGDTLCRKGYADHTIMGIYDKCEIPVYICKTDEGESHINFTDQEKWQLKPHWKPSEEQINAFEHFVRSIGESGYASPYDNNTKLIYSLLNDLKNL